MPSQLVQTLEAAGISTRGLRDAETAEPVPIEPGPGPEPVEGPMYHGPDEATRTKARWTGYAILGGLAIAGSWLLWSSYKPKKGASAAPGDDGLEGARALKQLAAAVGPGDEILEVQDLEGG